MTEPKFKLGDLVYYVSDTKKEAPGVVFRLSMNRRSGSSQPEHLISVYWAKRLHKKEYWTHAWGNELIPAT